MAEVAFKKSTAREYFESLVITVILALFGTTFIVQAFKIPTPSMEDNLLVGDHLLVNKFAFGARGSVLDKVLPLPPAALPFWDGKRQTLIDAAKAVGAI